MKANIVMILCKLEQIFLLVFFDITVYLVVHLPLEAEFRGLVQYYRKYPIEITLGKYKRHVGNRAWPDGSISRGYLVDEYLMFFSIYLHKIETRCSCEERNDYGCLEKLTKPWMCSLNQFYCWV
jgi:hypothetical protein